ncbi:MAG: hypothetical protein KKA79_03280 [Nanoarchaeota archaeon]|nr:hypothetical protein [Nanoarchaeota archaeon]
MIAMICSDIVNGQLKKIPELRMTRFKYDITSAAVSFGILLYLGAKAAYWAWGTPIGWFALLFTIGLIAVMIFLGKKAIAGPDIWWKGEKKAKFPETEEAQEEDDQCESKG